MPSYALLPADLPAWVAFSLIAASGLTSFITAALGIGGGMVLLGIMAVLMPGPALIPVHAVVQIGSNSGRTALMLRHVRLDLLGPFVAGSLVGVTAGGLLAVRFPDWLFNLALGGFLISAAWGRPPVMRGRHALGLGGALSSFLTMLFGATGPFVAALVKTIGLGSIAYVATFSACMTAQHGLKIVAFGTLGFDYRPYLPLLAAMIGSGFLGTLVGRRLLDRLGDRRFGRILQAILTLLALQMLYKGMLALLA
ncbi:MAG: sulfite exporter TauE/SafE family protein [Alphaproteobacteria bacterium]|nr:sulfite exporter TauE/SafE family protein [Alphaproteobacteria bacterium]